MTVHVKTINGKTISMKCNRKQKSAVISDEVERKSSIPRGVTFLVHQRKVKDAKKTMENNFGAENTIEMSLLLVGGMEKSDIMDRLIGKKKEREKKKKTGRNE